MTELELAQISLLEKETRALTVAFVNEKGGVGKTTTTLNVAYWLSKLGFKVLVIDLSAQGSYTKQRGYVPKDLQEAGKTISFAFSEGIPLKRFIIKGKYSHPDFIPASKRVAKVNPNEQYLQLREMIAPLIEQYHFILIDSPPEIEHLIMKSMAAADSLLIPVEPDDLSVDGLADLIATAQEVRRDLNPTLALGGVLPTQVMDYAHDREFLKQIEAVKQIGADVLPPIPFSTLFRRATKKRLPASHLYPEQTFAKRYKHVAELMITYNERTYDTRTR